MNKIQHTKNRSPLVLYRILLGIVFGLVLCISGGTVYALLRGRPPVSAVREGPGAADRIFTGIGRIRAATGGESPAAVILAVTFPYDPDDRFFAEELSAKVGDFRRISAAYFASLSAGELARLAEGEIKAELLRRYNAGLRLGRIGLLYFNEFMIIE
jgi:flagellar basal body-associated protein FliL